MVEITAEVYNVFDSLVDSNFDETILLYQKAVVKKSSDFEND